MEKEVSIIFVNYKTHDLLFNAIQSVINKSYGFTYEIIIVDNSCDDKEYELIKNKYINTNIKVINSKENLGFGKANNLGSKFANGKYLYFLNTDTLLINNAIFELKEYLDNNPNTAVVGSNLFNRNNKPNSSYRYLEKNLKNEIKNNSLFNKIKLKIFKRRIDFNYSNKPLKIYGYVSGASLMIRKNIFDSLNGFDKDIFMYAEESLLCYKVINDLKYNIYNIPCSKIIHFEGESMKNSSIYYNMFLDGNYIYYKKLFGEKEAVKFIKREYKIAYKKSKFYKLINKRKYNELYNYSKICKNKLDSIINEQ